MFSRVFSPSFGLILALFCPRGLAQQIDTAPLSSVAAVTLQAIPGASNETLPERVQRLSDSYARGTLPEGVIFPLPPSAVDNIRTVSGLNSNVVVSWLDPLTHDASAGAPRFGANCDYIAWFGDGWHDQTGRPPQWNGSGNAGWIWVNHEYISSLEAAPRIGIAPLSQHATLARFMAQHQLLDIDPASTQWTQNHLNQYIGVAKRQLGGSWLRIIRDPGTGQWHHDRSISGVRYDATSSTLLYLEGNRLMSGPAHDDQGKQLPDQVVVGIMGDCSGGQTPWGTIITAEENVQDYYGDFESCWGKNNVFISGRGFDPGHPVSPVFAASPTSEFGQSTADGARHARDNYGWLSEVDPGVAPNIPYHSLRRGGEGLGHRKIGALGRARFENCTFAVDRNWRLLSGEPIVFYAADDRFGGRIFKFVSSLPWKEGMNRAETRALIDEGHVYVAHLSGLDNRTGFTLLQTGKTPEAKTPGQGRWIHLSTKSKDLVPNGAAFGKPSMTVGEALRDNAWNGIGGFPDDDTMRLALFTVCNKVGIMELNRPEDVEWNPRDPSGTPRLLVALTKQESGTALDQEGRLIPAARHAAESPTRKDPTGFILSLCESDPLRPAASSTFTFSVVWHGSKGDGLFDAAAPDNIAIDPNGGIWFGTDGNPVVNRRSDAYYFLDLDPRRAPGAPGIVNPTFGKALRLVSVPSDAEATGPCFTSDARTFLISVQHPGEFAYSRWPRNR